MKKDISKIGIIILIIIFSLFYLITTFFLDRRNLSKKITPNNNNQIIEKTNYNDEKQIANNLYQNVRILYDVVNNKYKVDQNDTITIGEIIYKKITNFDEVTGKIFTHNGINKYVSALDNYFAYTDHGYYLAGNLVSYQTYYFRGDESNIYITSASETEINAIIYERWTSNNKNTLATIKVVLENEKWLIDNIEILATE